MRKNIIQPPPVETSTPEEKWLDLAQLARVEVTSEEDRHPIEAALLPGNSPGWRAGTPGAQTIRLLFDSPQRLQQIHLRFVESLTERRQEFVLRWSADGHTHHEIVRQQWNFSPKGATTETEDYRLGLSNVSVLELTIVPDTSGGDARASLAGLRLA